LANTFEKVMLHHWRKSCPRQMSEYDLLGKKESGRPSYYLCFIADCRLVGKLHLSCFQNCVLLQDGGLRLVVSERLQHPTLDLVKPTVSILFMLLRIWWSKMH
jgi:hypothetical protein